MAVMTTHALLHLMITSLCVASFVSPITDDHVLTVVRVVV
jgi:hypothetical protein